MSKLFFASIIGILILTYIYFFYLPKQQANYEKCYIFSRDKELGMAITMPKDLTPEMCQNAYFWGNNDMKMLILIKNAISVLIIVIIVLNIWKYLNG